MLFRLRGPALFLHAVFVAAFFFHLYNGDPNFIRIAIVYAVVFGISLYREIGIQKQLREAAGNDLTAAEK